MSNTQERLDEIADAVLRRRKASSSPFTREPDCLMDISADKKEIRIVTKHGEQINNSTEKNKK